MSRSRKTLTNTSQNPQNIYGGDTPLSLIPEQGGIWYPLLSGASARQCLCERGDMYTPPRYMTDMPFTWAVYELFITFHDMSITFHGVFIHNVGRNTTITLDIAQIGLSWKIQHLPKPYANTLRAPKREACADPTRAAFHEPYANLTRPKKRPQDNFLQNSSTRVF